jgi:arylsulfatase A-like enzyme
LKQKTMPECLRDAGYHTAAIGKWHVHSWPHDIGFAEYVIPRVHHCHTKQYYTENGGPEMVAEGWSLDFEVERAGQFFQQRKTREEPFFLYFNISPPHCPVADIPEEFRTLYDPAEVPLRGNVDESVDQREGWCHTASVYRHDFRFYGLGLPYARQLPEGYGLRELTAEYYGAVTWADAAFGRLLDHLEAAGLDENTLVVFSADHGDFLGSHGRFQKGQPHDESARVPLIARWLGQYPAGETREGVVSLLDLAPTFLAEAGVETPAHMHGESLAGIARDAAARPRQECRVIERGSGAAIRTRSHTLSLVFNEEKTGFAPEPDFFTNNLVDPLQTRDLSKTGADAVVMAQLRENLEAWNRETPWMDE